MRLVFAGTPEFAERALTALLAAGHDIALVLTQPDRPAGRGMRMHESAVKRRALEGAIPVFQPRTLKDAQAQEVVREAGAQALVVAAYGLLLPPEVLAAAPLGGINIHASLLPRWRGAAPIQRALMAGDGQTGISIMRMDQGLDTGPVILRRALEILPDDDAGTLHDRLAALGARAIVDTFAAGVYDAEPQSGDGVTYAAKISREDARLDWRRSATDLERLVRAMRPSPGAQAGQGAEPFKVWRAEPTADEGEPGTVLRAADDGIVVACGKGGLRLLELQRAGGKRLAAAEYLRGARASLRVGERLPH